MKWLVVILSFCVVQQTHAQETNMTELERAAFGHGGVGVGNGSGGTEEEGFLNEIKSILGETLDESNLSQTQKVIQFASWSSRALLALERGKNRAQIKISRGDEAGAYTTLFETLKLVERSLRTSSSGPLTKSLAARTLTYMTRLDQELENDLSLTSAVSTKLNLLFNSYKFIIEISGSLDRNYFIPFKYQYGARWPTGYPSCNPCGVDPFDYNEYQKRFLKFAAKQLDFIRKVMTLNTHQQYLAYDIVPKGSHKGFLVVAELMTKYLISDVSQNIYNFGNFDALLNLSFLHDELKKFNNNQGSIFFGKEHAVYDTAIRIDSIRWSIQTYFDTWFCGHSTCTHGQICTVPYGTMHTSSHPDFEYESCIYY